MAAWRRTLDSPPAADAAADELRVYLSLDDGTLVALDRATGEVIWQRPLASRWPPVPVGRSVFVAIDDRLHQVDAATGRDVHVQPMPAVVAAPVVSDGDRLLIPLQPDTVMAWHPDQRRELWRTTGLAVRGRAVVDGEELFLATTDSRLVALSKGSGDVRWSHRLSGALTDPVVTGDRVVVGSTADWVFALDRRSGDIAWDWHVWADVTGLAADRDRVYVIGLDNLVRALDRRNGNQHWREALGSRLQFAPLLDGATLLVAARHPALHGFDLATGAARGTFSYPDHPELQIAGAAPLRFPGPPSEAVRIVLFTRTEAIGLAPAPPPPDEPARPTPSKTGPPAVD